MLSRCRLLSAAVARGRSATSAAASAERASGGSAALREFRLLFESSTYAMSAEALKGEWPWSSVVLCAVNCEVY